MNMVEQVTDYVKNYDEEVGKAIELELGRQRRNLELIASENIISPAVMNGYGNCTRQINTAEGIRARDIMGAATM